MKKIPTMRKLSQNQVKEFTEEEEIVEEVIGKDQTSAPKQKKKIQA